MWRQTSENDWYWPLHPVRPQDHLRVWRVGKGQPIDLPRLLSSIVDMEHDGWYGAIVMDGEYLDHCRCGPFSSADAAKDRVRGWACEYLGVTALAALAGTASWPPHS